MDITEKSKQRLLHQLSRTNRKVFALMETPEWKEKVRRPKLGKYQTVLAYEIYSIPSNQNEHKTITILNQLVEEGKVKRYLKGKWLWYQKV